MFKVNEGRPNVADHILNKQMQLIVNTPLGRESFFDDRVVRRVAMLHSIPCITTLTGASAAVEAIRALRGSGARRARAAGLPRRDRRDALTGLDPPRPTAAAAVRQQAACSSARACGIPLRCRRWLSRAGISAGIFLHISGSSLTFCSLVCLARRACVRSDSPRRGQRPPASSAGFRRLRRVSRARDADSAARTTPLLAAVRSAVRPDDIRCSARSIGRLRADALVGRGRHADVLDRSRRVDGVDTSTSRRRAHRRRRRAGSDQILQWRAGRRVAFPATLRKPGRYLNPGVPRRGASVCVARHVARRIGEKRPADRGRGAGNAARRSARVDARAPSGGPSRRSVAPWSARSAAVVTAILIGDRAGLDDEVERRLQEAGTYHVIAISGGNIAILAALCLVFCAAVPARAARLGVLVIVMLTAYAIGGRRRSSVGRATLMAAIYFARAAVRSRTLRRRMSRR